MDAQLIRRARELVGESQAAFGARFGVDQSTAHRWETQGPPPRGPGRMALAAGNRRDLRRTRRATGNWHMSSRKEPSRVWQNRPLPIRQSKHRHPAIDFARDAKVKAIAAAVQGRGICTF
jgi:transcriptional regulator with XRE-family HTH domain